MKDKLTKKRIRVDYESMIIYLHLDADFVRYVFSHNSKVSSRRQALAFLRSKRVDITSTYYEMKDKGLFCDNDRDPIKEFKFADDVPVLEDQLETFTDNSRFY